MADGCMNLSAADYAVAVSGIAGPDGGNEEKPVGTVWFAWAARSAGEISTTVERRIFEGDREQVRLQTVVVALQGLRVRLREDG
jgi:nicotinamide-nucleotide amidase